MGCSNSVQASTSTVVPTPTQVTTNSKSLIDACRSGDRDRVAVLLKTMTLVEINKADWSTGDTPLHLAVHHGYIDIARLLLHYGALRNISNYQSQIPVNYASTTEMKQLFERATSDSSTRFVTNDSNPEENEQIEWSQNSLYATQLFMEYENEMSYSGQWDINQTVESLRKASELENLSDMEVVWNLFEQAREKTDAKYLIRAYTVESKFSQILNQKLAQRRSKKSVKKDDKRQMQTSMQNTMTLFNEGFAMAETLMTKKLQTDNAEITDWVHRYIATVHTLIHQPSFPFTGLTYRAMWIRKEKLLYCSENQLYVCNKTFISTSKDFNVAKRLIDQSIPSSEQIPVMCTYFIDSSTSFKVIDIHTLSEYPDEEEVLIFPGLPFEVRKIHMNATINMVEIELVPMLSDFEN